MLRPAMELQVDTVANWEDLSGYGNHAVQAVAANQPAIITGGVMFNQGSCYDFDGLAAPNNDYFEAPYDPSIRLNQNFTISIWFRTSVTGTFKMLMDINGATLNPGLLLYIANTNLLRIGIWDGVGASILNSTIAVTDGLWHSCVAQRHNGFLWLYIDGQYNNQLAEALGDIGIDHAIRFGSQETNAMPFPGQMVRPRIYQAVLTASEIASQYKLDLVSLRR